MLLTHRLRFIRLPDRASGARSMRAVSVVALALLTICLFLGALIVVLGSALAEKPVALVALPAGLVIAFAFLIDRPKVLLVLLLTRASLDSLLEATKINFGSVSTGVGGLLNALIIALTISIVLEHGNPLHKKSVAIFGPFLAIGFAAVLYSPATGDAIKLFLALLTYFCTFIIGIHLVDHYGGARNAVKLLVGSSVLPVVITLAMVAGGITFKGQGEEANYVGTEAGRFAGPFSHPNLLAFYMMLNIALVMYLLKTRPPGGSFLQRRAPVAYLGVLVLILLLTKTRSAWVGTFAIFLLYGVFVERRFLIYLALVMLLSTMLPSVRDRLADLVGDNGRTFDQYARLNSYDWRKLLWSDGIGYMKPSRYLMGYGLESFRYLSSTFFTMGGGFAFQSHNVFVEAFFEMGLLGLMSFIWTFVGPGVRMFKAAMAGSDLAKLGLGLTVGYVLVCYSDNVLTSLVFNVYLWMTLGVVHAGISMTRAAAVESP